MKLGNLGEAFAVAKVKSEEDVVKKKKQLGGAPDGAAVTLSEETREIGSKWKPLSEKDFRLRLGEMVSARIKEIGMKASEVAEETGFPYSVVMAAMNGKTVKYYTYACLFDFLAITPPMNTTGFQERREEVKKKLLGKKIARARALREELAEAERELREANAKFS